jgi:hypothetical protein
MKAHFFSALEEDEWLVFILRLLFPFNMDMRELGRTWSRSGSYGEE